MKHLLRVRSTGRSILIEICFHALYEIMQLTNDLLIQASLDSIKEVIAVDFDGSRCFWIVVGKTLGDSCHYGFSRCFIISQRSRSSWLVVLQCLAET